LLQLTFKMKISIFCLIVLGLIVQSQVLAHAGPHTHEHTEHTVSRANSKVKKDGTSANMNLAKSQTTKAATSAKEEQVVEEESVSNVERFLTKYFPEVSKNKVLMMIIAVLLISLPSFPTFLVLVFISKLSPGKQKGGIFLNEKHLRRMICLAIGSLTGDVFFGMMEHIMNCKEFLRYFD